VFHYRERQPWYDTAQICLNGHTITWAANTNPHEVPPRQRPRGARGRRARAECGASSGSDMVLGTSHSWRARSRTQTLPILLARDTAEQRA